MFLLSIPLIVWVQNGFEGVVRYIGVVNQDGSSVERVGVELCDMG